jgi:hypothetical protein
MFRHNGKIVDNFSVMENIFAIMAKYSYYGKIFCLIGKCFAVLENNLPYKQIN